MINRIYATGCEGRNINDLKPLVQRLGAILVDIRFSPYSQVMVWRQVYLKALLGSKYLHISNLGNRSFRQAGAIAIQNLKLGLETLLSLNSNVILFCACENQENCHRRAIAEELKKRSIEIVEINDWSKFGTINERRQIKKL